MKKNYYNKETEKFSDNAKKWLSRASAMATRRSYYEPQWRDAIFEYIRHAINTTTPNRSFDPSVAPEFQEYNSRRYTTTGFKLTSMAYPLEFAVILRKLATEFKNIPPPSWVVRGEDDQSPSVLWQEVYLDILTTQAEFDVELFEAWLSKNIFGSAFLWSRMVDQEFSVKEPIELDANNEWVYKEKKTKIRQFKCSNVDIRNVLIDEGCKSPTLRDCEYAIVFEYYSEEAGKIEFGKEFLTENNIKTAVKSQLFQDVNDMYGGDQKAMYEVMHCYDVVADEYAIFVQGVEYRTTPIPQKSRNGRKEIPLAMIIDHKVPGQPYGHGEPAIIKTFREIKNKNRNLIYDVTKKGAKPTIAIDPMSAFAEENYTFGQDFIRIAPGDMQPIPIQMNLDPALNLDERTDQDITITTGVNIRDVAAPDKDETATRTVARKESQLQIIDLGLTMNAIMGLTRVHRINANIILLNLKSPSFNGEKEIITRGKKIFKTQNKDLADKIGKYSREEIAGTHTYRYEGDDLDLYFEPILEVGNIAISEQLDKNIKLEGIDYLINTFPGQVNATVAAEEVAKLYKFNKEILAKQTSGGLSVGTPEADEVDQLIQKAGVPLPEEIQISNQYKNAQSNQALAQAPQGQVIAGGAAETAV